MTSLPDRIQRAERVIRFYAEEHNGQERIDYVTDISMVIPSEKLALKFVEVYKFARSRERLTEAEFPMWGALSIYLKIVRRKNTAELTNAFMEKFL